jgi:hypothetical protein
MSILTKPRSASFSDAQNEVYYNYVYRITPPVDGGLAGSGNFDIAYTTRSFKGWDTGSYHRRLRSKELISATPWDQYESSGSISDATWDYVYDRSGTHFHSYCTNAHGIGVGSAWKLTPEIVSSYAPATYDEYVMQAAAAIYNQGWDALTFVAELGDVQRMFSSLAKAFMNLRLVPKNWRELSSAWLSYRYGWRPLISDIKSIRDAINHIGEEKVKRHKRTAKGSIRTEFAIPVYTGSNEDLTVTISAQDTVNILPSGCVIADIYVPTVQFNLLQTGWELIPFSFVVDWLVNVGTAISALAVVTGATRYVAAKGFMLTVTRDTTVTSVGKSPYISGPMWTGHANSTAVMTRRVPCTIPLVPRPVLRLRFSNIIDSISLILQRLK